MGRVVMVQIPLLLAMNSI